MQLSSLLEILIPIAKASIGQVPGQTYAAQVVDEKGNGLPAAFFFIDSNGTQIMSDTPTDSTGLFHFTIPNDSYQNIFVQIYSFDQYTSVVKTFDELVNNPKVVLKSNTGNNKISTGALIALAGAGIVLLASNKKKKMGATYIEQFKSQSTGQKVLLLGGGLLGAYLIIEHVFKHKPTPEQQKVLDDAKSMLDHLAKDYGIVPSLPAVQYSTYAVEIVRDLEGCGTNEDGIYRIMNSLNNEADIYMLIIKCNILNFQGCGIGLQPIEGDFFGRLHLTLPEALQNDLDSSEIDNVNHILYDKGIKYRF